MKKIVLPFVAILSFLFVYGSVYADNNIVYESENNYSFYLPQEWEKIPSSIIEEYRAGLSEQYEMEVPEYSSGFQLKIKDYFEHPYILTQEFERGDSTFEDLKKEMSNYQDYTLETVKKLESIQVLSNIDFSEALVYEDEYAIFVTLESDTPTGTMKALGSIFLGRDTIVHIFFYSTKDDYEGYLPIFYDVISSFEFDYAYSYESQLAYDESQNTEEIIELLEVVQKKNWWETDLFYNFIVFGVVGVFVAIFVGSNLLKKNNLITLEKL